MKAQATHPAVTEFVATTARDRQALALAGKPELIREQMNQHAEIVSSMREEFGKKQHELEQAIGKLRRRLSEIELQRETAIVKTSNGWLTIDQILEQRIYRDACPNCRKSSARVARLATARRCARSATIE
jgi:N6-adenosine-specific RNA methylase IME4